MMHEAGASPWSALAIADTWGRRWGRNGNRGTFADRLRNLLGTWRIQESSSASHVFASVQIFFTSIVVPHLGCGRFFIFERCCEELAGKARGCIYYCFVLVNLNVSSSNFNKKTNLSLLLPKKLGYFSMKL